MSYSFLHSYMIPTTDNRPEEATTSNFITSGRQLNALSSLELPPPPPIGLLEYCLDEYQAPTSAEPACQNVNRFIPPGKHGTNYRPQPSRPRKRKAETTGKDIVELTADGKLVIFQGRDESYPDDLNRLIHPLMCELCTTKMNSMQSAKDHYECKAHDRSISAWLSKNYTENGLDPPDVKRFFKTGPIGAEAFHCDICDLKLTSLTHANQHYAGRKHRLVAKNVSKPSGAGYYDADGSWVRTGSKLTPSTDDGRFGIGEQFKLAMDGASASNSNFDPDTTTSADGESNVDMPTSKKLHCSMCKINVTSTAHMAMHLIGAKHRKKLKMSTDEVIMVDKFESNAAIKQEPTSILASLSDNLSPTNDLSMYRTPTGSYYCRVCNSGMCHISALQQHLLGKKHKKAAEEKTTTGTILEPNI